MQERKIKVFRSQSGDEAKRKRPDNNRKVVYQLRPVFQDTTYFKEEALKTANEGD